MFPKNILLSNLFRYRNFNNMAPLVLPQLPPALKGIQHYLKIATDYDKRDPTVSYWSKTNDNLIYCMVDFFNAIVFPIQVVYMHSSKV